MLLSLKWMREFVPYEGNAQELGDRFTMLGLELEEIIKPYEAIKSIIVGHIVQCSRHAEADKLSVCQVDIGQGALLDIVCGAPNVAQGQKVPIALVGTIMPGGLEIKKAVLRGQASFGMICSERELGLSDAHDGIMILPEQCQIGQKLIDALDLDLEVLDISITPNRADCLSVMGLAREAAMAFNLPFTLPEFSLVEQGDDISDLVPIEIVNPELCWLYQGRILKNIKVYPSPLKIRHRLFAVGVRPISNIVDVTNYMLMECGQPFHAFDKDCLEGGKIIVAPAHNGEKLLTLDGQEHSLSSDDLCIRDAHKPVGLAGVMGGLNSEITERTQTVFLESAIFQPASIRKTARRLGLSSESSFRFERGVDQVQNTWALNRTAAMMAELSGAIVCRGICKVEPRPYQPKLIKFRPARVNALLGTKINAEFCNSNLLALGCKLELKNSSDSSQEYSVIAPSWRHDLSREADLIEEIGRIYGLDKIEPELPVVLRSLDSGLNAESKFSFWARVRHWARGLGLNEAVNYSFVGQNDLDFLNLPKDKRITILNPLSAEQDVLRTVLAPGLLRSLKNNLAHGATGVRLFELAHVFATDSNFDTGVSEKGQIGFVLYGNRFELAFPQQESKVDYVDIKGIIEHFLHFLHLPKPIFQLQENHPYLLPAINISIDGISLGCAGRVKNELADNYNVHDNVWLAELDLEILKSLHDKSKVNFQALAVFPPIRRDITVMAELNCTVNSIVEHVKLLDLALLENIVLIDMFEPKDEQVKNMTFRLTFRHAERTLKDAEVDKLREKIAQSLVKELKVKV